MLKYHLSHSISINYRTPESIKCFITKLSILDAISLIYVYYKLYEWQKLQFLRNISIYFSYKKLRNSNEEDRIVKIS